MMSASALAEAPIKLFIYGQQVFTDVAPIAINGRTLVPIRAVTEHMPAEIEWIQKTQEVVLFKDGYEVVMKIGSKKAHASFDWGTHIEYESFTLDQPPIAINGRTLVPIRFISERLNQSVRWDGANNAVHIGEALGQFTDENFFKFDDSTGTIAQYSLNGPKEVNIPPTIRGVQVKHIGKRAFATMELEDVTLPEGLVSIGDHGFAFNKLFYISLPNSLSHIGNSAFQFNELESLTIPYNVNTIGWNAFTQNKLTEVDVMGRFNSYDSVLAPFDPGVRVTYK